MYVCVNMNECSMYACMHAAQWLWGVCVYVYNLVVTGSSMYICMWPSGYGEYVYVYKIYVYKIYVCINICIYINVGMQLSGYQSIMYVCM